MFAKPTSMFAGLPAPSRIDFGSAWKARCASESPSTAISGRVVTAGLPPRSSRRLIADQSRSVPSPAASKESRPARSASSTGGPKRTRNGPRRESRSMPRIAAGTSGTPAASAIRAVPDAGAADASFAAPSAAACPPGTSPSRRPSRTMRTAVSNASTSPSPRRTGNDPTASRARVRRPGCQSSDFAMKCSCRWVECAAERPWIEVGRVVCSEHEIPLRGHVLQPADAETVEVLDDRNRDPHDDSVEVRRASPSGPWGQYRPLTVSLWCSAMSKTLVIAEKPSVGRDIAAALPGSFAKSEGYLESDEYVVSWAVGHLVGLAAPEAYDAKLKKWRYADLPIVPSKFKLTPNDDRAKKQLTVVHKLMQRDDVESIVNACDAGREGELIFAYIVRDGQGRQAGRAPLAELDDEGCDPRRVRPPSARKRDEAARGSGPLALRGRLARRHERDACGDRPTALRLRRGRVARQGADADPCASSFAGSSRSGRSSPSRTGSSRRPSRRRRIGATRGRYLGGKRIAEDVANGVVRDSPAGPARSRSSRRRRSARRPSSSTTSPRSSAMRTRSTASRPGGRSRLPRRLYEEHKAITYPRTSSRFLTSEMIGEIKPTAALVGENAAYAKGAAYVTGLEKLPLGRVVNDKKVDDHHAIIPTRSEHKLERMKEDEHQDLRPRRQALSRGLPP